MVHNPGLHMSAKKSVEIETQGFGHERKEMEEFGHEGLVRTDVLGPYGPT